MDLKNIQTFVAVSRELSFAKAAEQLHLSQPSVTSRIQALEAELGKTLFVRNRRNIHFSKEGEAFLPFALQLLEVQQAAEDKLKRINQTLEGKISIGATALWSVHILPEILGGISRKYPYIEFKVMTGNSGQIQEMLLQNEVDIGLVSSAVKKNQVKQVQLKEYPLELVCSPKHPFAQKNSIDMMELINSPLVTYEQKSDAWKQIKVLYAEFNAVPNVMMELNQIDAAKAMVAASFYVCLLPCVAVERELREERLAKVHVKELESLKTKLSMIYLEQKESYPIIELIIHNLRYHFYG